MLRSKVETRADGSLDGRISGFFEADMASHVVAGLPGMYALIPLSAPGVTVVERPVWDKSRRLFDVVLSGHAVDPALVLARGDAAQAIHDHTSPSAHLALAADSLGGASAALAMTVEYLGMRKQFDRPLAMFQALKHRCADLKIMIGATEALLWTRARDETASGVDFGALKAHATDVYRAVVEEMIQLHGGIGLTEEHQSHLFMKRAMLNLQLCGSTDYWREKAGRLALAASAA
jgi:alkylation response protein AidB-like acyl-CoA dehydrogenase